MVLFLVLCGAAALLTQSPVQQALGPTPLTPAPSTDQQVSRGSGPPSCVNSDGSTCPASYFTGPLGEHNLVPTRRGAFLIEYYNEVGVGWPQVQQAVVQRQHDIGRTFDGIQIGYGGGGTWDGVYGMYGPTDRPEQWIISNGSFVAVTWTPEYTIGQMNEGRADEIWAKAANYWKSFAPHPIMLRPFVEFNNPSMISAVPSPENGNVNYCGAAFVSAWRRMVKAFQDNRATNVGFWFTPHEGNNRSCVDESYPGDAYVDWVGADVYNSCFVTENDCYSSPLHQGPATFGDLFGYSGTCADGFLCKPSLHDLLGPKKPFVVGETGTVYDASQPFFKGDFYRLVATDARRLRYLRGLSFFDADVRALEGPETDWRVDQPVDNPNSYNGFKATSSNAWFRVAD
jgi:hypothetical protein